MRINTLKLSIILLTIVTFSACSSDDSANNSGDSTQKSAVISNYADIVAASYQAALTDAQHLKTTINAFVATPTDANFTASKNAWKTSRESYGVTEAFRFASGPIDDVDGPEGLLNSWPLDESYIDYVEGAPNGGIVNSTAQYPTIDKSTLEGLNQPGSSEENVSVGYHAIEFLLWGQDLTDPSALLPGQRPYTDFVDGGTAANQDRRRQYLAICADLLTDHLQMMVDTWQEGGTYRATFLALNENTALKNIITGIGTLAKSELAVERMSVALVNQDQEDEHSCFSDNTHRDIRLNLGGIANVYRGSFGAISGSSIEDLFIEQNATLGAEVSEHLATAEATVNATAIPFDFAITDATERPKVQTAVLALQSLGDKLVEGAESIGVSVNIQ